MERKFQRFISCLFMILVVVFLFGCKQPTDSETGAPTQPGTGAPTQPGTGALPSPTNLSVTAAEDAENFVTLTWSTGTDVAEYYWIYYSTTNDTTALKSPQKKVSLFLWDEGTGTCDIGLDKSGTYYFWVKAANGYGEDSPSSAFSTVASHQFTYQPLSVPENLNAEKYGEGTSFPGIKLSWNPTNAPYYHIYWSESNDSNTAKKLTTTSSIYDTIYESVYELKKGTTYYFWVKSANGYSPADSDSGFSNSISFTYN